MNKTVTSYRIHYTGQAPGGSPYRAVIHLFGEEKTGVGKIFFVDAKKIAPDHVDAQGLIIMRIPTAQYLNVVDLLRNEGPLKVRYDSGHGKAFLFSGLEPTGDGEL